MAIIHLDRARIASLRRIDTRDLAPCDLVFPDFMIVGPQKTGTTWLYDNLNTHRAVRFTRVKEPFFFCQLDMPFSERCPSRRLEWYTELFMGKAADGALVPPPADAVCGEASAGYAVMRDALIEEILKINPDIKAILLIRHPVERAWSHAKMKMFTEGGKPLEERRFSEFRRFYLSPYMLKCADFTNNIARWQALLKPGHFTTMVSEKFAEDSLQSIRAAHAFLGLPTGPEHMNEALLHKRSNVSKVAMSLPGEHREFLSELHAEEMNRLNERYGTRYA